MTKKRILIIVGEASGDLHAAKLVKEIQQRNNQIHIFGMGGKKMSAAGVEMIEDCANISAGWSHRTGRHFPVVYSITINLKIFCAMIRRI